MSPRAWILLLLVALTWLVYAQALEFDFINYDDPTYVIDNPRMQSGLSLDNVRWAFTTRKLSNWHPVTWLSLLLDGQLFGIDPHGFHLTNVLLHTVNVLLLFCVLEGMTGATWRSGLVAALFAVHPANIEVVAWISSRKNLLFFLFAVAAIGAYVRYARRREWRWYALSLVLFFISLSAKQMLVTLPCVLLLLDYWPLARLPLAGVDAGSEPLSSASRRRWDSGAQGQRFEKATWMELLAEKLPFFVLALGFSIVAYLAQASGGVIKDLAAYSLPTRLLNAVHSYGLYLLMSVWPVGLSVYYPHPGAALDLNQVATSAVLLIAVTSVTLWQARRRPYLLVGWLWFLGTLVPVLQLVQLADVQLALRYLYFPFVGLFIAGTWLCCSLLRDASGKSTVLPSGGALVLALMTALAVWQTGYWRDSIALFRHAIDVTPGNALAHTHLGVALQRRSQFGEAIAHQEEAIRIDPGNALFRYNLAMTLLAQGRTAEAIQRLEQAVELRPDSPLAYYQLGSVYYRDGKTAEAVRWLQRAVEADPNFAEAHLNLGRLLLQLGDTEAAARHLREALRLRPGDAEAERALRDAERAR